MRKITDKQDGDKIEFSAIQKYETDRAFLLNDGDNEEWFPKSQCEKIDVNIYIAPEWLLLEKGFI